MNDLPQRPLPEIQIQDQFSMESLPSSRADAGGVGLWAGLHTGFVVGMLLGLIGMASMTAHGHSNTSWMPLAAWLLGGTVLGGVIGWAAGLVVGPTQKELAGGLAGAIVGMAGGIVYSPLVGYLIPPLQDANLEVLRRGVIGAVLGLVIGAGLGIFHKLLRPRRRRYFGGPFVSSVEQDILDELDTRAGVRTGYWK